MKTLDVTREDTATACRLFSGPGGVYPLWAKMFVAALTNKKHTLGAVRSWHCTAYGFAARLSDGKGERTVYLDEPEE